MEEERRVRRGEERRRRTRRTRREDVVEVCDGDDDSEVKSEEKRDDGVGCAKVSRLGRKPRILRTPIHTQESTKPQDRRRDATQHNATKVQEDNEGRTGQLVVILRFIHEVQLVTLMDGPHRRSMSYQALKSVVRHVGNEKGVRGSRPSDVRQLRIFNCHHITSKPCGVALYMQ